MMRARLVPGVALLFIAGCDGEQATRPGPTATPTATATAAPAVRKPSPRPRGTERVPRLLDRRNVYAADRPGRFAPAARGMPARVYVPDSNSNAVDVVSRRTGRIIRRFPVGGEPQHVVPAYDLKTLWVTSDQGNSLTPVDPRTGRPRRAVPVADPYNMYFTPDGRRAIVVAERLRRLDFRRPHSMKLVRSVPVPGCPGVDHMDATASGRLGLFSCEFGGKVIAVRFRRPKLLKTIPLRATAMPQDVKLSPDGRVFYVADMKSGGVWLIDARRLKVIRFQPTGAGAHGLYPSRDARLLYVSNRDAGTITRISFATRRPVGTWRLPAGASPDMGGVSANGRRLWLTGRYDGVLYEISTRTGRMVRTIRVGSGPHGAVVWPQPGRYSLGHTGVLR